MTADIETLPPSINNCDTARPSCETIDPAVKGDSSTTILNLKSSPKDVKCFDDEDTDTISTVPSSDSDYSSTSASTTNTNNNNFVPLRPTPQSSRHPDCIKHTLPKFQYKEQDKNNSDAVNTADDEESFKLKYRTARWISDTVKWRTRRQAHMVKNLKECGCPDCCDELAKLESKK